MLDENLEARLRIGILAHEFLINIGANDFLKNIIRGLALREQNDLIFLCPRSNEKLEHMAPQGLKLRMKRVPFLKPALRAMVRRAGPVTDRVMASAPGEYDFYVEACPRMKLVTCESNPSSLAEIRRRERIDVFLPSIHVLPESLPYVTYWPDCQPKHYPEFFDDESQRVRDERIRGLLSSGKPMIINSRDAKHDMVRFYQADPAQIFELPFAPIVEFDKLIPHPERALAYDLNRPYFIVCNQFWVHKSTETVIQAAALCKRRGLGVDIVFTGRMEEPRRPGYVDSLFRLAENLDLGDSIRFLGYIPKDDQLELIKGALAVVQPTLFEGGPGGGAVYDALSLGTRAIVSDIPVNRELPVDSGRVVLFAPKDPEDLVDKMEQVMHEDDEKPSSEDLYQLSRRSVHSLSEKLYAAIDHALSNAPQQ